MSIDKKAFGISDSLVSAVNEALKGGQVKLDKNHNGKLDGQDFKMLRKEEVVDEGNPANKEKKNAAAAAVGAKNRDSQYLSRMNPSVADKIRGREKMSGKDRQQHEEVEQMDELSTDTYHSAAHKAAKRAMGDAQGRSGPIFKKYAGMANKFRDKGMSQEKKEKAMKEEVDLDWKKDSAAVRASKDQKFVDKMINKWGERGNAWLNHPALTSKKKKAIKEGVSEAAPAGASSGVADQMAARKDALQAQIQRKIAQKQMSAMQSKANKRISNINASNDCGSDTQDDKKKMKGGKEPIEVNPPMREAAELPKKVITKGHEIAKSLIKHRSKVDNPYAVGMAQAKKSAKMKAYRADRDKHGED